MKGAYIIVVKPHMTPRSKKLGLRRSHRTKLRPLRHYAGERPVYEYDPITSKLHVYCVIVSPSNARRNSIWVRWYSLGRYFQLSFYPHFYKYFPSCAYIINAQFSCMKRQLQIIKLWKATAWKARLVVYLPQLYVLNRWVETLGWMVNCNNL